MSENPEKVILIIKAANQSISDLKIESELDQTVLHIKNRISEAHPIKPPAGEQRLIYSGQLLQDKLILKTVLRHPAENNSYTIHLVCSTPRHLTSNRRPLESSQSLPSPQIHTTNENIVNSTEGMSDSTTDGIRRRLGVSIDAQTVQQPASVPIDPSTVYPHFSQFHTTLQFAADPIQQMAAMQQMYAHYMAYMQYMQSGAHDGFHFPQESTYSSVSTPIVSIPQTNVDIGNQQNQMPLNNNEQGQFNNQLAQPPNGPMRMNAQGGAGEEDEDRAPRDWLDYIYFSSRMIVLLCVVYFYSTVTRLTLVVLSCLFIYMYQAGWVRAFLRWGVEDQAQQQQQQQQQQLRNNDVIHGQAQQRREEENLGTPTRTEENEEEEEVVREESLETEGENRELEGGEAVQNVVEGQPSIGHPIMEDLPPQPSLLALSWTFLTSFFTSLIPEQHQIV